MNRACACHGFQNGRLSGPRSGVGKSLAGVPDLALEHFYPARERGIGNEILPPSIGKVNNLQVAVLSDETRCPFLHFRLLTIGYLI